MRELTFVEVDRNGSGVRDLRFLAERVAAGRLDTQIGVVRSWRDAPAGDRPL